MQETKNLGKRVRVLHKAAGLTNSGLAKRSGLAMSTIRNIAKGVVNPRLDTLAYLAHGLGTDIASIVAQPKTVNRRVAAA